MMRVGGWSDFKTMRKIYTKLAEQDKSAAVQKDGAVLFRRRAGRGNRKAFVNPFVKSHVKI